VIRRRRALMIVIAHTRLFALFPLTEDAVTDDGLFDVWVFHGSGFWTKARHVIALLLRRQRQAPNIDQARARRVEVRARPPLPVQLDGEPWGFTPMTFEIVPRAMTLWLPNTAPSTLFGDDVAAASPGETNQSAR
ncbi:MAG: diacylglycerol kinase family lipid kinase, partial [Dehalococcoidia bacterium]|nr:diacylglycerol kinase family lipid kinase [Dehalococcoidia bacterium]